jgi:hypothetical protein
VGSLRVRSCVAIIKARPETILDDYTRLLRLIGIPMPIGQATALRFALYRTMPFPASNIPPWSLEATARVLQAAHHAPEAFAIGINVGQAHGYRQVAQRIDFPISQQGSAPQDALHVLLGTVRRGPACPIGGGSRLLAQSLSYQPDTIINTLRHRSLNRLPTLAVLDGTTIGNGPPGDASHPEIGNLLIASLDPIAADAVMATLLAIHPIEEVAHLALAHSHGLGCADPGQIELIGDTELIEQRWRPHPARSWNIRRSLLSWPAQDRERYTSWVKQTDWGKLFASYYQPETQDPRAKPQG